MNPAGRSRSIRLPRGPNGGSGRKCPRISDPNLIDGAASRSGVFTANGGASVWRRMAPLLACTDRSFGRRLSS
ncbi:hypothetical protein EYF80_043959 [Liparis tanakae]|uniref:Uncharacterized protein n=1 Tax=Liparis tanakae TaxID=230148 RepID=A0A4Z2FZ43_9TELE|nr:hypothetical protein EYF80_043959 [Liparis tanakae]